jgi:transcriptional regulator with XRE-family HTH domain
METESLLSALKRQIKARGLTYADVAEKLNVSLPTVKRTLSEGSIKVDRLLALCNAIGVELDALVIAARHAKPLPTMLSSLQERALVKEPRMLGLFHLLLNEWQVDDILNHFVITQQECERLLLQLDKIGVLELHPGNQVKLAVARGIQWRPSGPIAQAWGQRALNEYLIDRAFVQADELLRYTMREVSEGTRSVMQRKLALLAKEFDELADLDVALPPQERRSVGMLVAIRPWAFSVFNTIERRK